MGIKSKRARVIVPDSETHTPEEPQAGNVDATENDILAATEALSKHASIDNESENRCHRI
jgi:hypothetical protein